MIKAAEDHKTKINKNHKTLFTTNILSIEANRNVGWLNCLFIFKLYNSVMFDVANYAKEAWEKVTN